MISLASSTSQRDPIRFTDAKLEDGAILESALDIMYTLDFDFDSNKCDVDGIRLVIDFAKKWEVSVIPDFIRRNLARDVYRKGGPKFSFDKFLIAFHLGDNELVADYYHIEAEEAKATPPQAAGTPHASLWHDWNPAYYLSDTPKATLTRKHPLLNVIGDGAFNLGSMPHQNFLCIPPTVVWIILRTQELEGKVGGSTRENMKQLLDMACESILGFHLIISN
jgi:hypothetical protein